MSTWTDKNHRIDVSYDKNNRFICVEHPALVRKPEKAISTIGGIKNLEKIYGDPMKRLPLQWRPEDFYCKATYGDRIKASNLLMKVCRRRRKSDGKEEYEVKVLGIVETVYKFQAMVDFQYLPVKTKKDGTYESIYEKVCLNKLVPLKEYMNQDVPLYIPPMMFARVDKPCDFQYKQEMKHRPDYKNPDTDRPANLIGTIRQRRSIFTIFVNFGEELPTAPIPEAVKRTKGEFVDPKLEKVLKELFEEKPLYLKIEMEHRTGIRSEKLKIFLPAMCFYWLDGPWRGQWNKFGYDPTKTPASKIYQTIDFRIRQVRPGQVDIKAKRDILKLHQWNQVNRNQKHNVKISLKSLDDTPDEQQKEEETFNKELYYKFRPDKVPPHRMMYYPVCYVELDEVQTLVHENDGKEKKCSEKDGWCVEDFNNRCRDIMYSYLNRLLGSGDSVEFKFWRTKKRKRQLGQLSLGSDVDEEEGDIEGEIERDIGTTDEKGNTDVDNEGETQRDLSITGEGGKDETDLGNKETTNFEEESEMEVETDIQNVK
ncbi:general transcription factor 3C polypeptide 5-like [Mercenaria mercenaria]|uniref:general transcription factor 3C polypeptide 5-like n=1 Tax=Mercenaria mercenaria TaxID=6596 RepID=UPI001E1D8F70|nr:general transcription factor 3C polypeptide 5-like [Mercenaria mercenaria]